MRERVGGVSIACLTFAAIIWGLSKYSDLSKSVPSWVIVATISMLIVGVLCLEFGL